MNFGSIGGIAGLWVVIAAAVLCAVLIVLLQPWLKRYALARPNRRSSHREPTPQGGGIAVMAAAIVVITAAIVLAPSGGDPARLAVVLAAAAGLAIVGVTDDIYALEVIPRLLLQAIAVGVVIAALPPELRIFHVMPWWIERALLLLSGLWFVNLVNFMDGIDWMTVAETVPVSAGLVLAGLMGALPSDATVAALALGGAMLGFAPFNRPVAKLFLGDVGSLPIGLLLGWLLVLLAGGGHIAAALLLPLYYLADATVTMLRRLVKGEQVLRAHRSHFYQRAMDAGFPVYGIIARVFAVNAALLALAMLTLWRPVMWLHIGALIAGAALVGALLWSFSRSKH